MSSTQVHLVMLAAGLVAYAAFALPCWHGGRPRAARHAFAALAALACALAPWVAARGGWAGAGAGVAADLSRAGTVAALAVAALATGLTLAGPRPSAPRRGDRRTDRPRIRSTRARRRPGTTSARPPPRRRPHRTAASPATLRRPDRSRSRPPTRTRWTCATPSAGSARCAPGPMRWSCRTGTRGGA